MYRQDTWQQVVTTDNEDQRLARLEEYSVYVDTVESQILKEIAALQAHSTQFFEASSLLQVFRLTLCSLVFCMPQLKFLHGVRQRLIDSLTGFTLSQSKKWLYCVGDSTGLVRFVSNLTIRRNFLQWGLGDLCVFQGLQKRLPVLVWCLLQNFVSHRTRFIKSIKFSLLDSLPYGSWNALQFILSNMLPVCYFTQRLGFE